MLPQPSKVWGNPQINLRMPLEIGRWEHFKFKPRKGCLVHSKSRKPGRLASMGAVQSVVKSLKYYPMDL